MSEDKQDNKEEEQAGTPEQVDEEIDTIKFMQENPGFYIGRDPGQPGQVPIMASMEGKLYSMKIDGELDPSKFLPGTIIEGPFQVRPPEEDKESDSDTEGASDK